MKNMSKKSIVTIAISILIVSMSTQVFAGQIFVDDFESDTNKWTTVDNMIIASGGHHGNCLSGQGYVAKTLDLYTELYMRSYVKFSSMPTSTGDIQSVFWLNGPSFTETDTTNGLPLALIGIVNDGVGYQWMLRMEHNNIINYVGTGYNTIIAGAWYCVEIYVNIDSGIARMWIEDNLQVELTGLDLGSGINKINGVQLATYNSNSAYCHDDTIVSTEHIGVEGSTPPPPDILAQIWSYIVSANNIVKPLTDIIFVPIANTINSSYMNVFLVDYPLFTLLGIIAIAIVLWYYGPNKKSSEKKVQ